MGKVGAFICPYFGKLPSSFPLWLTSCEYNKDFDFFLYTDDDTEYRFPKNVERIIISFKDFQELIQSKFNYRVALNDPYKLCDFKPTYGHVFSDKLKGYDYIGHCDLDMVLGDLIKFIPKEQYDKISYLGHLALYRNDPEVISAFQSRMARGVDFIDVLSSGTHFGADEIGLYSINEVFMKKGLKIYPFEKQGADISPLHQNFFLSVRDDDGSFLDVNKKQIFLFDHGAIRGFEVCGNEVKEREYAYLHLQKRVMNNLVSDEAQTFLILPHTFRNYKDIDKELIESCQIKKPYVHMFAIKAKAGKRLIMRSLAIEIIKAKKNSII